MEPRIPLDELFRLPIFFHALPAWSRNRFAFYWNKTGRVELYTMDLQSREVRQMTDGELPRTFTAGFVCLETRELERLTEEPRSQKYPVMLSPDGSALSIVSNRAGQLNLFTLDLTTGQWQQLTNFPSPVWSSGAWSPDGQWLTVSSNETPTLTNADGYLVRRDGSELRKVFSMGEGSRDSLVAWHPDGNCWRWPRTPAAAPAPAC